MPLYERAIQIHQEARGKNHPLVAQSLLNLARLYQTHGEYARAEPLYQRGVKIFEAALGPHHPDLAKALDNLAGFYGTQGDYERAEPLLRRGIAILEAALGNHHPEVAASLCDLATLYAAQGEYRRAEALYVRALQIQEAALGNQHPDIALLLNNLAALYHDQGKFERTEALYQRALQIREAALGKEHPGVAGSLNNLATFYADQGADARAEPLFLRALQIQEATLEKNHPAVAISLSNLALLQLSRGEFDHAEPLFHRALQIQEAALDKKHPHIANSLWNLARLDIARNHLTAALPRIERTFALFEQRMRKEALSFSAPRLTSFLELLRTVDMGFYSLLREHPTETAVRRLALRAALLHKGRSLDELTDLSKTIYRTLKDTDRQDFEHLRALRTQLSTLSFNGSGNFADPRYQTRLQQLEVEGDGLESKLAARSVYFRTQHQLPMPAEVISQVAASLPRDGALIEILSFAAQPVVPPPNTPAAKIPSTPVYVALILLPSGKIHYADLGPAAAIDAAVKRFHDALTQRDPGYQAAAQALYHLIFAPIAPLLGAQKHLYISPDGQLNLVPFAALHDGTRFLADTYDITYLTSGRDLLRRNQDIQPTQTIAVFAPFATDPTTILQGQGTAPTNPPHERSIALQRFIARNNCAPLNEVWPPLPGTRQEAGIIRTLWPDAQLLLGPAATRDAFLALSAPGLLIVPTHGFFMEDCRPKAGTRGVHPDDELGSTPPAPIPVPDEPLLRSGLLMAHRTSLEEGIVTALEIGAMNLWGTQLVVLSACDTGRGEVKDGHGVAGLRRAFVIAGAETVVSTLWKVDDRITQALMGVYYKNLQTGHGRSRAMRMAAQTLREQYPHPHDWAPFIVAGSDAPLRGLGAKK